MARILVMDDEQQIRGMLRRALEEQGHEVLEASDGTEGVRCYRTTPVDLVITDILMPYKEGLECIRELRKIDPEVLIIAISGGSASLNMDALRVARHFGALRTFRKPFDLDEMLKAVRAALDHRSAA